MGRHGRCDRHGRTRRARGSGAGQWLEPVLGTMAVVALSATLVTLVDDDKPLVQLGNITAPSASTPPPTTTSGHPLPPGAAGGGVKP
ncbi:hypothetical protein [Streptoalloteichus hindustanus]|uniref:Uncharacterized protein n=1 Tax=Streptoalloteichus hindustanus TaxID=2017 RepID=A0A1M5AGK0_STRHI|nr:hypothetical protein [Streptoalloteichus hindustanus]SHF29401.1 hypothetical protein SAMN05444320_103109 [Streptoalloteichus hindustanus]